MSEARCAISVIDLGGALVPGTAHAREVALDVGVHPIMRWPLRRVRHPMSGRV
jgi:hypothetical protein